MVNADSPLPTIGASGAIAGVMGAYLVRFPHSRILTLIPIFFFLTTYELPAAFLLLYWFIIQFFSGVGSVAYSHASEGGTAWFAHVGGFLTGIVLVSIMPKRPPHWRRSRLAW
jgi:membrane associated rhomboid family serine protease